jgi:putative glutamine amidotransferase
VGKRLGFYSLLLFFAAFRAWGGDLFVWEPGPGYPRMILYATDPAHREEAVKNYLHQINNEPLLREQVDPETGAKLAGLLEHPIDIPIGKLSDYRPSRYPTPSWIMFGNKFTDLTTVAPIGIRQSQQFQNLKELGAEPYLLPPVATIGMPEDQAKEFRKLVARGNFDGVFLLGGRDVAPELYGEKPDGAVNYNAFADKHELAFIKEVIDEEYAVLAAVCRGHQACQVVKGGKLVQDVPSQTEASLIHEGNTTHDIWIEPGSKFQETVNPGVTDKQTVFPVNSIHHQVVVPNPDDDSQRVVGRAADMHAPTVEAIEFKNGKGYTYQYHPEMLMAKGDPNGRKVMKMWVDQSIHQMLVRSFSEAICGRGAVR